jgi:hypothetical protein
LQPVTPDGVLVTTSSPNGSLVMLSHTYPATLVRSRSGRRRRLHIVAEGLRRGGQA